MRKISISATSQGATDWVPVDRRGTSGDDYLVVIEIEGGSDNSVDFEFSPDRPANTVADSRDAPTLVIQHNVLKDLSESLASTMVVPFQSFRLNVKKYTAGTITATVVEGGEHGN